MTSSSRPALGVEVGAALAAADRHAGQGVLEDLLEAEELDDAEVDRRVEPQPALVRAERAVELDAEAAVDLDLAAVVLPRHPEDDLALGLADPLDDLVVGELGVLGDHRAEDVEDLADRLVELGLARVATQHLVEDRLELLVDHADIPWPCRAGSATDVHMVVSPKRSVSDGAVEDLQRARQCVNEVRSCALACEMRESTGASRCARATDKWS